MSLRHSITLDSIEFALESMAGRSSVCAKSVSAPINIGTRKRGDKIFLMVGGLCCYYSNLENCADAQAF